MLLTADQVAELTGKVRPAAQRGVLLALGIPFKVRPDGSNVVLPVPLHWPQGSKSELQISRR